MLGLRGLGREEILLILEKARHFKDMWKAGGDYPALLRGKTVANLFFEPSTRTRVSFEVAAQNLGGRVVNFEAGTSSVQKGESLRDTVRTMEALGVRGIVLRHPLAGAPGLAAREVGIPLVNAGDGCHEHPTQALLDLFTLWEKKGSWEGWKVLFVGDILHSRVFRSNLWGLTRMGVEVSVVAPLTLVPRGLEELGVKAWTCLDRALEGAGVVYVLRLQEERQQGGLLPSLGEYRRFYSLTGERLKKISPGGVIMHPGPVVPGLEIAGEALEDPRSLILEQVRNGVFVRMAVLALLGTGEGDN